MNPNELAAIIRDSVEEFEEWYKGFKHDGDKEGDKSSLQAAYLAAQSAMTRRLSAWLDDRLYKADENAPKIQKGQGLETYLNDGIQRLAYQYANAIENEAISDTWENYQPLLEKMAFALMSGYSGKVIEKLDDDDGIYGEEADTRHKVFDRTFGVISAIKTGKLKKDACVNTFRALADFVEREL